MLPADWRAQWPRWGLLTGALAVGAYVGAHKAQPGPAPLSEDLAAVPQAPVAAESRGDSPAPLSAVAGPDGSVRPRPKNKRGPSREKLAENVQSESERLGIKTILAPQEEVDVPHQRTYGIGDPEGRTQAEEFMAELALMRQAYLEDERKPVPIEGRTAAILARPEESRGGAPVEDKRDSWSGLYGHANEAVTQTVSGEAAWAKLWRGLSGEPVPLVDFSKQQVVAVFLGPRPTQGYSVEIVRISANEARIVVLWKETEPPMGKSAPEGVTSPYVLRLIPKSDLPVRFEKAS